MVTSRLQRTYNKTWHKVRAHRTSEISFFLTTLTSHSKKRSWLSLWAKWPEVTLLIGLILPTPRNHNYRVIRWEIATNSELRGSPGVWQTVLLDLHFAPRKTFEDLKTWLNRITSRVRGLLKVLPLNQLCDPEKSLFSWPISYLQN